MKKTLILAVVLFSFIAGASPKASAQDFFDMNDNGITDFADPTSPMYWALQNCNDSLGSNGGGGGGGPAGPHDGIYAAAVIGGITLVGFSMVATAYCKHGADYMGSSARADEGFFWFFIKEMKDMGKWYGQSSWCGTKEMYHDIKDFFYNEWTKQHATITE